ESFFKKKLRPTQTVQLLMSIPGIGDITGSIIAMETGDINRFADAKHYCSYCRLAPGANDSGGKRGHRSGSKDGNQYLKYAFTEIVPIGTSKMSILTKIIEVLNDEQKILSKTNKKFRGRVYV
ncbi:MAG: IS110 family transposase, partial [Bacteroidota bacterium]|nr:IS110 family transposase [Bacteroidota bacterium]